MPRLLVVTPSFLPNTSADMQRARQIAGHAHQSGWAVEVLCIDPRDNPSPQDPELLARIPHDVRIHRVRAPRRWWHRLFRYGSLFRRCVGPLRDGGDRLIESTRFDLVYFTSTAFNTFPLGCRWYRRFAVPYAVDYQDPWVTDYYRSRGIRPPGGRLKYLLAGLGARRSERAVLQGAVAITSVSEGYVTMLQRHYVHVPRALVVPFGSDLSELPKLDSEWPSRGARKTWVSVGAVGSIMERSVRTLLSGLALARRRAPDLFGMLNVRFVGTSYAVGETAIDSIMPIARSMGISDLVSEQRSRIPMVEATGLESSANRVVVLFSDDPDYRPSKLSKLILLRCPLVMVLPGENPLHQRFSGIPGVTLIKSGATDEEVADVLVRLDEKVERVTWPEEIVRHYSADHQCAEILTFFAKCIGF